MFMLLRWAIRLLGLLLIGLVAVAVWRNAWLRPMLEDSLRASTGMDAQVGQLRVHLWSPTVRLERVLLYARAEHGGGPWLVLPEVYLEYDFARLLRRELRFKLVRASVLDLLVLESGPGRSSLSELRAALAPAVAQPAAPPWFRFTGIETLNLSMGRVIVASLQRPGTMRVYPVNIQGALLRDMTSLADLHRQVVRLLASRGVPLTESGALQAVEPP
jgi:hypothetical protein